MTPNQQFAKNTAKKSRTYILIAGAFSTSTAKYAEPLRRGGFSGSAYQFNY